MGIKIVQSFAKGDEVPHWMLDLEPSQPGSRRGRIIFGCDCHVVEVAMGYFVVPDSEAGTPYAYQVTGADDVRLFASSRTVITPMRFMVTAGPDDDRDPGSDPDPVTPLDFVSA